MKTNFDLNEPMHYKLSNMFTNEEQLEKVGRCLNGELSKHMKEFIKQINEEIKEG